MKILHIAPEYPPQPLYGCGRYVQQLAASQAAAGDEVHVLVSSSGEDHAGSGPVRVHRVPLAYPFAGYHDSLQRVLDGLSGSHQLVERILGGEGFDVVCVHDWAGGLTGSLIRRVFNRPLVSFVHACEACRNKAVPRPDGPYRAQMQQWLFERSDRLIITSKEVAAHVASCHGIEPNQATVIPEAIDPDAFSAEVDAEEFRGMFAESGQPLVLFAGRLEPETGADIFAESVEIIRKRIPAARFVIAGDGPLQELIAQRLKEQGHLKSVRLVGHVGPSVLGALYRVSDLLALPCRYRPAPRVAVEAGLFDLPIVQSQGDSSQPGGFAAAVCEQLKETPGSAPRTLDPSRLDADQSWDQPRGKIHEVLQGLFSPQTAS